MQNCNGRNAKGGPLRCKTVTDRVPKGAPPVQNCNGRSAKRGPLRCKTVTDAGPKQAFRCLDCKDLIGNDCYSEGSLLYFFVPGLGGNHWCDWSLSSWSKSKCKAFSDICSQRKFCVHLQIQFENTFLFALPQRLPFDWRIEIHQLISKMVHKFVTT